MSDSQEVSIESVQCGICDSSFGPGSQVSIARQIAKHWNDEHGDELRHGMDPFKTEEYAGRHLHGDEYAYRVKEFYITAYDVLDDSGASCGPFAYEYVREPEAIDHCDECWRSIQNVDGYREVDTDGWKDSYLCDRCHREQQIERRKNENQNLGEFA